MRKLLLSLLALAALCSPALAQGTIVGPGNLVLCPNIAVLAVGPTSITQIVAASGAKSITICGWHVTNTGASGTFSFSYGTGTNCGTGTQQIIPPQNVSSSAPATDHIDYGFYTTPLVAGVGQALCITPSVATIAAVVYYNQF